MSEKFSLKDHLFNPLKVQKLSAELLLVYPAFEQKAFVAEVLGAFPQLELKARIDWISSCLRQYLPTDYRQALQLILAALPPACDPSLRDGDFGDFIYAPYSEFVAQYGCNADDLELSLQALKAITTRFSAEAPIRRFLNAFPEQTLAAMAQWATDSHYHVRRLVSEGTRPKLPWAPKISLPPAAALPLLDALHADPTRFVTRSVANHLNDIAKIQPELVLQSLERWRQQGQQRPEELDYITRHALRTLVKQGHADSLSFLGYHPEPQVVLSQFQLAETSVKLGQTLAFDFELSAQQAQRLVIDYRIHFQTAKGKQVPKVFKLKNLELMAGQRVQVYKKHPLRLMTTKKLYPGEHLLELQINGQSFGQWPFELTL